VFARVVVELGVVIKVCLHLASSALINCAVPLCLSLCPYLGGDPEGRGPVLKDWVQGVEVETRVALEGCHEGVVGSDLGLEVRCVEGKGEGNKHMWLFPLSCCTVMGMVNCLCSRNWNGMFPLSCCTEDVGAELEASFGEDACDEPVQYVSF